MHNHYDGEADGALVMPRDPKNTQTCIYYTQHCPKTRINVILLILFLVIYIFTFLPNMKYVGYSFMCLPWAQK